MGGEGAGGRHDVDNSAVLSEGAAGSPFDWRRSNNNKEHS